MQATPTTSTLHPYIITCAGLQYVALATSAFQAIADAITLHGARIASASPMRSQGGAA